MTSDLQFHIFDEVLSPEAFAGVVRSLRKARHQAVLDGEGGRVRHLVTRVVIGAGKGPAWADAVLEEVLEKALSCPSLVGKRGLDWTSVSARGTRFSEGCGISWHADDRPHSTGSYVFFAHPAWQVQWGGELMVADASAKGGLTSPIGLAAAWEGAGLAPSEARRVYRQVRARRVSRVVGRAGVGHFIVPKPNRLVVLGGGHPHRVNRAQGGTLRTTVSGFFLPG